MLFATTWQLSAGRLMARHLVWAWIVLAIYGVVEEMTQPPVGRVASIWDWIADVCGAGLGLLAFVLFRRVFEGGPRTISSSH
jgi:VanZ family protein